MELKGRTAIITGSSGRLGSAIAKALGKAGCNCICHYNHNQQKAKQLAEQIQKTGVKAIAVEADLTKQEQINDLLEKASEFGTPQVLINSAAVFSRRKLEDVTIENTQEVLNLNLITPILVSQAFAAQINAEFSGGDSVVGKPLRGKIINMGDVSGIKPWAEYVVYCSSKAGLIGATKALAKELAPKITVNSVAVGIVEPGRLDTEEKKRQISFIPAGRIGEASEVTAAIIFLLENDYITGQVLCVDGGRCM